MSMSFIIAIIFNFSPASEITNIIKVIQSKRQKINKQMIWRKRERGREIEKEADRQIDRESGGRGDGCPLDPDKWGVSIGASFSSHWIDNIRTMLHNVT